MMDFALSNRCNLSCVMCNGTLSSTIRQQREHLPPMPSAYDGRFFAELREFLPHLERAHFKGGEPFLASETTRVWDEMLALGTTAEVVVTTNGTVMSDRSKRYLIDLAMHPIVSVDAVDANMLESIRVGVDARRLWCNIDEIQALVEDIGNGMTLTFCLMRRNWRELGPFLSEVQQRGLSPNVVPVNSPRSHSLRSLDRSALAKVRHELRGQRDGQNDASNDVMRIWAKVLDWIGSLSADTAGTDRGVPVLVSGANQPVEDLRRWSKATLLEVDVREEVVFAVKGSSSSVERLDAGQWVGRSARDIPGLLGAHLGVPLVLDSVAGSGGVLTAVLVPQDGSVRAPEVRGVLVSFDGANRATLHVGFR